MSGERNVLAGDGPGRQSSVDGGADSRATAAIRVPPHVFFLVSAVFHYLGPACAVLLFAQIEPLGVAWLRITTAAVIFGSWCRPWRLMRRLQSRDLYIILALGCVLAAMNMCFYIAIDHLPLGTVGAIEFLGPVALAASGARHWRNIAALMFAIGGVYLLTDIRLAHDAIGYLFAFANCALFTLYIMLGHRIAKAGGSSIDRLALAMLIAMIAGLPFGIVDALPALHALPLFLAALGVGVASSVIPYVCDQLAMARLPRATFALFLALLPAFASLIGALVLRQIPSLSEAAGVGFVIAAVFLHRP
ncbi:MAG: EamA family transporter [Rhodospirillaceae bacterium]|nr:MAG: EamA family transporter [Rhodospirillaceae bacterium]